MTFVTNIFHRFSFCSCNADLATAGWRETAGSGSGAKLGQLRSEAAIVKNGTLLWVLMLGMVLAKAKD